MSFTRQYAIRMPDGRLFARAPRTEKVADYSVNSAMRDMMAFLGMNSTIEAPAGTPQVVIFDNRKEAETLLGELRKQASMVGVDCWGGCVVERLCTPFTSADPAVEFAREVVEWVARHGGTS